jgi:quercetin dioxygenase-like cupin family protein
MLFAQVNRQTKSKRQGDRMNTREMLAIDTNAMPWEERYQAALGKSNFRKLLLQDPDTGMEIRMVRYPAGFVTTWHTHPCAHGMFVLEGTLVTHAGSFGPGGFVWFPEGMLMEHGATAETDVVALFITNKKFEIHFVEKEA